MKKALCIISGGLDSTTCAYIAKSQGYEIIGLHFDYEQRTMRKERECFEKICDEIGAKKITINANFIANIGANALTDKSMQIPKNGLDSSDNVPITYVPFRNGIFLSIATAIAEKEGCEAIFIGVVEEDSSGYPDCTQNFIESFENALNLGTATNTKIKIQMPLVHLNKAQIVQTALDLGVNLALTWSCYEREDSACGLCESCLLRLRGFKNAGQKDLIKYIDDL